MTEKIKKTAEIIVTPLTVCFMIFFLLGCSDSGIQGEGMKVTANVIRLPHQEEDAEFLVNTAGRTLSGIMMGRIAESNSASGEVKEMARNMEREKKEAMDILKKLAAKKLIVIPVDVPYEDEKFCLSMAGKKGIEFDEAYCNILEQSQKQSIAEFEDQMNSTADRDIREWAISSLPAMKSNLLMVMECKQNIENKHR